MMTEEYKFLSKTVDVLGGLIIISFQLLFVTAILGACYKLAKFLFL